MATSIVLSQSRSPERRFSPPRNSRNRNGGGLGEPVYEPGRPSELEPRGGGTPVSAYRMFTFLAMFWIAALFATLTLVLVLRWVHSADWVSIPLPYVLYVDTAILLGSSLTIEFARFSRRADASKEARWIRATLLLGVAFIAGQIVSWQELTSRGLHLASNPGSFFFFLITGAHGLLFLGAIGLLTSVGLFAGPLTSSARRQAALNSLNLYWHFVAALWLYSLFLLVVTIQR